MSEIEINTDLFNFATNVWKSLHLTTQTYSIELNPIQLDLIRQHWSILTQTLLEGLDCQWTHNNYGVWSLNFKLVGQPTKWKLAIGLYEHLKDRQTTHQKLLECGHETKRKSSLVLNSEDQLNQALIYVLNQVKIKLSQLETEHLPMTILYVVFDEYKQLQKHESEILQEFKHIVNIIYKPTYIEIYWDYIPISELGLHVDSLWIQIKDS